MRIEKINAIKKQFSEEFVRSECEQYPENFPKIPAIPVARYTAPAFYELEKRHLWSKSWLLVGMTDELPEIGSYKLWSQIDMPVLLVRGKDEQIRAFFNTCRHRGAGLVNTPCGQKRSFSCPFHGWTYNLEGQLQFVAEEYEFPDLEKSENGLIPLRCELWGNLIFINRDMKAVPLETFLGRAMHELAHFDFDKRKVNTVLSYELPCNWKIIVDAFQESYHIDATHTHTVSPILDSRGSVIEMWPNGHSILTVPRRRGVEEDFILDAGSRSEDPRHEITRASNVSFTIFPNLIGTCAEYQFPILTYWPTSLNTTHVEILVTEPIDAPEMDAAQAQAIVEQFGAVMAEDMSNVASIQKSIESGAMSHMQLAGLERRIYHFNEELDRAIGIENIPTELRIHPILTDYIIR